MPSHLNQSRAFQARCERFEEENEELTEECETLKEVNEKLTEENKKYKDENKLLQEMLVEIGLIDEFKELLMNPLQ